MICWLVGKDKEEMERLEVVEFWMERWMDGRILWKERRGNSDGLQVRWGGLLNGIGIKEIGQSTCNVGSVQIQL
jgi:NOL1/NOP2/fmu family ribosome biogenesis protein